MMRNSIFKNYIVNYRSFWLALFLFIIVNIICHLLAKKGVLYTSLPIALIDGYLNQLSNNENNIWLLGNSSLASGLEEQILPNELKKEIKKVIIGSGTIKAQSAIALRALETIENTPEKIVLFITKDDLNKNGERAKVSEKYITILNGLDYNEWVLSKIPLYSYRVSLKKYLLKSISSFLSNNKSNKLEKTTYKEITDINTTYLQNQGGNYEIDLTGLVALAQKCKRNKIDLYVVFPPVAKTISQWQKHFHPELSWPRIVMEVKRTTSEFDTIILDYSSYLDSTSQFFKDDYHMTKTGASEFTQVLLESTVFSDFIFDN